MFPINLSRKAVSTVAALAAIVLVSGLAPVHAALPSCSNVLSGAKSGSKLISYGNEWVGINGSVNGSASFRAADCVSSTGLTLKKHARADGTINVDAKLITFTISKVFNAVASVSADAAGSNASLVVKIFGTTVFSKSGPATATFSSTATSSISKSIDLTLLGVGVRFNASMSLTRGGSITVNPAIPVKLTSTQTLVANASASASGGVPCAEIVLTATLSKILGLKLNSNLSVGFTSASGGMSVVVDPVSFLLKICLQVCLAPDPCQTLVTASVGGFTASIFVF